MQNTLHFCVNSTNFDFLEIFSKVLEYQIAQKLFFEVAELRDSQKGGRTGRRRDGRTDLANLKGASLSM
jgi:hypothetical protein